MHKMKPQELATNELRESWKLLSEQSLNQKLTDLGLDFRLCNSKNRHYKIFGTFRNVDLYATTGTVIAAKHKNLKPCKTIGMKPERALERVKSLANLGY